MKPFLPILACAACASTTPPPAHPQLAPDAETVVVTYLPKAGQEGALQQEIDATWQDMVRLHLTANNDRAFYRGADDDGHPFFLEIFTWKDHDTPDHAPAEIEAHWKKLSDLVEARGARPGLQFEEIHAVPRGSNG
jgi:hypothetical protein